MMYIYRMIGKIEGVEDALVKLAVLDSLPFDDFSLMIRDVPDEDCEKYLKGLRDFEC